MEWNKVTISAKRDRLCRKHGVEVKLIARAVVVGDRVEHYQRTHRHAYWHGKRVGFGVEFVVDGCVRHIEYTFDDDWIASHARPGESEHAAYMRHGMRLDRRSA